MNKKLKGKIVEAFGSQADFAVAMRLDESIVSRVLHGRRSLSQEDREKWSRVLGCGPEVFEERS